MADSNFELRKQDHIRVSMLPHVQAAQLSHFDQIQLVPDSLPELNLEETSLNQKIFDLNVKPLFISSMTAGHTDGKQINLLLARAAAARGWLMGVGSQRKELKANSQNWNEWSELIKNIPGLHLLGNIGLSQVIDSTVQEIQTLVDNLQAKALFVHVNALQECIQPEGTPSFRGGIEAIRKLTKQLSVPVIIKEVGCGFSQSSLQKLKDTGVYAVDVAGAGGTHWGRIEGHRAQADSVKSQIAQTFKNWGMSTAQSLLNAQVAQPDYRIWASGGVRTGLDAAKCIAMGAEAVGLAQPLLAAALEDLKTATAADIKIEESKLNNVMMLLEEELRVALFLTGSSSAKELQAKGAWLWPQAKIEHLI